MPPTPPTERDRPSAPQRRPSSLFPGGWLALGLLLIVAVVLIVMGDNRPISYTEFRKLADAGQVKKFTLIGKDKAAGEVRDPNAEAAKGIRLPGGKFTVNLPGTDNQNYYTDLVREADKKFRASKE